MDKTNWYNATHSSLQRLGVTLDNYHKVCHDRNARKTRFKHSYDFMQANDIKRWKSQKNKKDPNKQENKLSRQVFSQLDKDNDGFISTKDLTIFLANLSMVTLPPEEETELDEHEHDFRTKHNKKLESKTGTQMNFSRSNLSVVGSRQSLTEAKRRSPSPKDAPWMAQDKVNFSQFRQIISNHPSKHLFFNQVFFNYNSTLALDTQLQMIMRQHLNSLLGNTPQSQKEKEQARTDIKTYQRTLVANTHW